MRAALALLVALAPAAAVASCVSQTYECLCLNTDTAAKGTIRSTDGGTSIAAVELVRTRLADAGVASGDVQVRAVACDAPGVPLLLFFEAKGAAGAPRARNRQRAGVPWREPVRGRGAHAGDRSSV